jgi:hypothetical protein
MRLLALGIKVYGQVNGYLEGRHASVGTGDKGGQEARSPLGCLAALNLPAAPTHLHPSHPRQRLPRAHPSAQTPPLSLLLPPPSPLLSLTRLPSQLFLENL